jgi:hypothetical protein
MRCRCCGRVLTHPVSLATGYGPECRERLGIVVITRIVNGSRSYTAAKQSTIFDFMD